MFVSFKEDFLHYIWRFQKYNHHDLNTTTGNNITIIHPGYHNDNAGPDFLNARIKIDENLWAGHVEIHKHSSEWKQHNHHLDPAYDNVILHVVYQDDKPVTYRNKKRIPTLVLNHRIHINKINKYQKLIFNPNWIPCASKINAVDQIIKSFWLTRMTTERLEEKTKRILPNLSLLQNDWDRLTYYLIAQYFGLKVNGDAFRRLFESIPFEVILKNRDNLKTLEAILLGHANLLLDGKDQYSIDLQMEYNFQAKKHGLYHMLKHEWKFSRMRPSNFPGLRIAQLAQLIHREGRIFQKILETSTLDELRSLFSSTASEYWNQHYRIGKLSNPSPKKIGAKTLDILIINVAVPLIFSYGIKTCNSFYKEKAIKFLELIPAEENKIITKWKQAEIPIKNAANTQALLYLKKSYCDNFKCLNCAIGAKIMS